MKEFIAEDFANYIIQFSVINRFDAIAILLTNIPMSIEDLSDIVEILKENKDKL